MIGLARIAAPVNNGAPNFERPRQIRRPERFTMRILAKPDTNAFLTPFAVAVVRTAHSCTAFTDQDGGPVRLTRSLGVEVPVHAMSLEASTWSKDGAAVRIWSQKTSRTDPDPVDDYPRPVAARSDSGAGDRPGTGPARSRR